MKKEQQPGQQEWTGRVSNTGNQKTEEQSRDISQIDQQEGEMNNGELGGNLNEDEAGTDEGQSIAT